MLCLLNAVILEKISTEIIDFIYSKYKQTINIQIIQSYNFVSGCDFQKKCWWMPFHRDRNMININTNNFTC